MDRNKLSRVLHVLDRIDRELGGLSELLHRSKYLPVPVLVKSASKRRK